MDVQDVKNKKKELETTIKVLIENFEDATNVCVNSIEMDKIYSSTLSTPMKQVTKIKIEIKL